MKTENRTKRYTLIVVLIILFLLGVYGAFLTYRYYGFIARGILGVVLIYLLFFFAKYSKIDISVDTLLSVPNKVKYFIFMLIAPMISYWATAQISEMVLFLWKR